MTDTTVTRLSSAERQLRDIAADLHDVKLAVCGDSSLGVPGLSKRLSNLESWRHSIDIRVAMVSGSIATAVFLVEHIISKLM